MIVNYEDEVNLTQAEYYMQECFELAKSGLGRTSPNPIVGAIVLDKNGVPVGKGFHQKAGTEHAEVIALREAGELAKGGTLIVNLEPCVHQGKTPPCCDLIIKSQIQEVIFSNYDPNPLVYKKGEKILLENNVKVIPGVLESSGLEINKFFFKWIKTKIPWITLKQAQTLDGKIGLKDKSNISITGELARKEVHYLRNIYDAILVGANTIAIDNPELTVREIKDKRGNKNPLRVILDPDLITKVNSNVYRSNAFVILVTKTNHDKNKLDDYIKGNDHLSIIELIEKESGGLDLKQLFLELGKREILSVLIEAGPRLSTELVLNKLIDEYILFISPKMFVDNKNAVSSLEMLPNKGAIGDIDFKIFNYKTIGNDLMLVLRPTS